MRCCGFLPVKHLFWKQCEILVLNGVSTTKKVAQPYTVCATFFFLTMAVKAADLLRQNHLTSFQRATIHYEAV